MKTDKKTYIVQPNTGDQRKKNPSVLRMVLNKEYTRIDFGYAAPWIYEKGGWIRIAPYTFIEVVGSKNRYLLKETINIPVAPARHDFESKADWKVFSLYFEPIPIVDCSINIIEEENPDSKDFNYYDIKLEKVKDVEMVMEIQN
jgi:hypothetical protein